jgi:hypothetical protein
VPWTPPIAASDHQQGLPTDAGDETRNSPCQGELPEGAQAASGLARLPSAAQPCLLPLVVDATGEEESSAFSHRLAPADLLAITALLYGRTPPAWMLLIPAQAMPHGRELSTALQTLLPQGERLLRCWGAAEDLEVWGNPDPPAGSGHSHA